MSVVSVADYRKTMEDETTPDATIQSRLDRAESRVSEYLMRPIQVGTYTENLHVQDAWSVLHPSATPIISVSDPANGQIYDGVSVITDGFWPWDMVIEHEWDTPFRQRWHVSITYTGGWDNTTIPAGLKEAIVLIASRLGAPVGLMTQVPVGAIEVKMGDASVRFAQAVGSGGSLERLVPGISQTLRKYRYRY